MQEELRCLEINPVVETAERPDHPPEEIRIPLWVEDGQAHDQSRFPN